MSGFELTERATELEVWLKQQGDCRLAVLSGASPIETNIDNLSEVLYLLRTDGNVQSNHSVRNRNPVVTAAQADTVIQAGISIHASPA